MGAMYRLKAYFGMVPAEEMEDYLDDRDPRDGYGEPFPGPRRVAPAGRLERVGDRVGDRAAYDEPARDPYEDRIERRPTSDLERRYPVREPGRPVAAPPVRGALAYDAEPEHVPVRPAPVPEQRDRAGVLSKITTLQPRSYNEARAIGERYRDGVPVIMNLTELDDAAAKRLVDFAAGLVFALRGGFDKVTNRVFLLTPADVEVSADDARRLAQRGMFGSER